jgi:hypothetical protein
MRLPPYSAMCACELPGVSNGGSDTTPRVSHSATSSKPATNCLNPLPSRCWLHSAHPCARLRTHTPYAAGFTAAAQGLTVTDCQEGSAAAATAVGVPLLPSWCAPRLNSMRVLAYKSTRSTCAAHTTGHVCQQPATWLYIVCSATAVLNFSCYHTRVPQHELNSQVHMRAALMTTTAHPPMVSAPTAVVVSPVALPGVLTSLLWHTMLCMQASCTTCSCSCCPECST